MLDAVSKIKGMRIQMVMTRLFRRVYIIRIINRELSFLIEFFKENNFEDSQIIL
jgi:hypothetical protein